MAERGKARRYTLQLEYRFDRLLTLKLERVYQLLVPDKRWPLGADSGRAGDAPIFRRPVLSRMWRS